MTFYRRDGQMGMEDVETSVSESPTLTRYGLGTRGVDLIERTNSSGTVTAFPVYDAHGNNVASLTRDGNGGYSLSDRRSYDAWGVVRAQQSGDEPKLRYCASLGHKQDDESGLVYMRARYYEPTSGRFISEDTERGGTNWFAYCGNNPVSRFDMTGKSWVDELIGAVGPLLQQLGVKGFFDAALKTGGKTAGLALDALSDALTGASLALADVATAMAESPSVLSRIGGAVVGRMGALALAASIETRELAMAFLYSDELLPVSLDDLEPPSLN